jgi:CRISPR-associated protein Csd2
MSDTIYADVARRHDFVLLFDVQDGNPNGDPDAGNLPRVDPETMHGLVTDVCLKRKVRDWIFASQQGKEGMDIYVKHRGILAHEQRKAYQAVKAKPGTRPNDDARKWMCEHFYDIRMFGAVMTTGKAGKEDEKGKDLQWNCGQVRGPLQLTFARSLDPVIPLDLSITRVALTNAGDVDRGSDDEETAASGQMGRKTLLPYGLYRACGFFIPAFAERTCATADDLALFWQALQQMWDLDRSSARGLMACRGLYVFTHENALGSAPAHALFDLVSGRRKGTVTAPRAFGDYQVAVDEGALPSGVTLTRVVG